MHLFIYLFFLELRYVLGKDFFEYVSAYNVFWRLTE